MCYYLIDEPFLFLFCAKVVECVCFMMREKVIVVHYMPSDEAGMESGRYTPTFSSGRNSRVTVEAVLCASFTVQGPINLGTNFMALPFGRVKFCINKYTQSPCLYFSLAWHFLFAWNVCTTCHLMMVSCAAIRFHWACCVNHLTPLNLVSSVRGNPMCGM